MSIKTATVSCHTTATATKSTNTSGNKTKTAVSCCLDSQRMLTSTARRVHVCATYHGVCVRVTRRRNNTDRRPSTAAITPRSDSRRVQVHKKWTSDGRIEQRMRQQPVSNVLQLRLVHTHATQSYRPISPQSSPSDHVRGHSPCEVSAGRTDSAIKSAFLETMRVFVWGVHGGRSIAQWQEPLPVASNCFTIVVGM